MSRIEYDCATCKDWGTLDDDTLCPAEGCPARQRRVAGAQRAVLRSAGLRVQMTGRDGRVLADTMILPPRTAA